MKQHLLVSFVAVFITLVVGSANAQASLDDVRISKAEFILSKIDEAAVQEFSNAWRAVGAGNDWSEAVVLLFRDADGSLVTRSLSLTNQVRGFKFRWNSGIIGVVHTHPNNCGPRPTPEDKQIADKYGVPVMTLTHQGMYLYDPETKKISLVMDNVQWLDSSKWRGRAQLLALK